MRPQYVRSKQFQLDREIIINLIKHLGFIRLIIISRTSHCCRRVMTHFFRVFEENSSLCYPPRYTKKCVSIYYDSKYYLNVEILLNQSKIILYLPYSDWFGSKRMSVWTQFYRKIVNTIWIQVDFNKISKKFLCVQEISPNPGNPIKRIGFRHADLIPRN